MKMNVRQYRELIKKKRNKYGNKRPFYAGRTWDSQGECDFYKQLELKKKAGEVKEIFLQVGFDLKVDNEKVCTYFIDFSVIEQDGFTFIEFKGKETADWRLKWKHFIIQFRKLTPEGSKLLLIKKTADGFSTKEIISRRNENSSGEKN